MKRCPIEDPRFCIAARCQIFGVCDFNRKLDELARRAALAEHKEGK